MKKKLKNICILILSAVFILFLSCFLTTTINAKAVTSIDGFTVEYGAEIRRDEPTGIRFTLSISKSKYNEIKSADPSAKFGVVIARGDFNSSADANSFLTENFSSTKHYITKWDAIYNPSSAYDVYKYNVAIYGIAEENFNKSYAVLGFVTVNGVTSYSNITGDWENIRSPFQVAVGHRTAVGDNMGYESDFINNVIDKVMLNNTTFKFSQSSYSVKLGDEIDVSTSVDGNALTPTYTFSDEEVAKIVDGKIKAVGIGLTEITASIPGASQTYTAKANIEVSSAALLSKGQTDYKVVVPSSSNSALTFAKDELTLFFKQATGVDLDVISDSGLSFNEESKYISLGRTSLLSSGGVNASKDSLGQDGYKIQTKGNTVFLVGGSDNGTINAVYGFLNELVDFKAYAVDEIYVKQVTDLALPQFNLEEKPDFETRAGGYYVTSSDKGDAVFSARLRTLCGYNYRYGMMKDDSDDNVTKKLWGMWAHQQFATLPVATYRATHPDWYYPKNNSGTAYQLCLSNTEMRAEFLKNLKQKILDTPYSTYYSVMHQDNDYFCTCNNCKAVTDVYGFSGLTMQFVNYLADGIKSWQATACPDREIILVMGAYLATEIAPKKIDDTVKAKDNVYVMLAPIGLDCKTPYSEQSYSKNYKGNGNAITPVNDVFNTWKTVANGNLMAWTYCNNFSLNLEWFDNFDAIEANFRLLKNLGVKYFYNESSSSLQYAFAFQEMMAFVYSELMWDCEQDIDVLIDDFMRNFYKEAYEPMKEYFNLINNYVKNKKTELGITSTVKFWNQDPLNNKSWAENKEIKFWNKSALEEMLACFENAYSIINANYTGKEKEMMLTRVKVESLTPRMYLLQFCKEEYTSGYHTLAINFERDATELGITRVFATDLSTIVQTWLEGVESDLPVGDNLFEDTGISNLSAS